MFVTVVHSGTMYILLYCFYFRSCILNLIDWLLYYLVITEWQLLNNCQQLPDCLTVLLPYCKRHIEEERESQRQRDRQKKRASVTKGKRERQVQRERQRLLTTRSEAEMRPSLSQSMMPKASCAQTMYIYWLWYMKVQWLKVIRKFFFIP